MRTAGTAATSEPRRADRHPVSARRQRLGVAPLLPPANGSVDAVGAEGAARYDPDEPKDRHHRRSPPSVGTGRPFRATLYLDRAHGTGPIAREGCDLRATDRQTQEQRPSPLGYDPLRLTSASVPPDMGREPLRDLPPREAAGFLSPRAGGDVADLDRQPGCCFGVAGGGGRPGEGRLLLDANRSETGQNASARRTPLTGATWAPGQSGRTVRRHVRGLRNQEADQQQRASRPLRSPSINCRTEVRLPREWHGVLRWDLLTAKSSGQDAWPGSCGCRRASGAPRENAIST